MDIQSSIRLLIFFFFFALKAKTIFHCKIYNKNCRLQEPITYKDVGINTGFNSGSSTLASYANFLQVVFLKKTISALHFCNASNLVLILTICGLTSLFEHNGMLVNAKDSWYRLQFLVFNFDDFYSRFALSVSFSNTFHRLFFLADHKVSELSN